MKRYVPSVTLILLVVGLLLLRGVVLSRSRAPSKSGAALATPQPRPEPRFVNIGTGGVTGVYYQVGGAVMKLMSAKRDVYGIRVSFQATGGSVYNINALLSGDLDVGVAQSDRQYQAAHGLGEWQDKGKQTDLRAICSLYPEAVTLVAAVDSGIKTLTDLKGKRVNVSNPGAGTRGNALDVLRTAAIDWEKDIEAEGLKAVESAKLLQDGRIDAFFYTVGHPAGAITEATAGRRKVRFVPIAGMERLLAEFPHYAAVSIPIKHYPKAENAEDVPTIGVMTTLVTAAGVPEEVVYAITREIFENLAAFRSMHPAFADLTPADMVSKGVSAPFHAGALKYYREAGLVK